MPPKFDPSEVKYLYLRAVGGEVGASSALAPKIGPLGLSPKKVGEDIAKATKDFKGIKVTVQLKIQNRQATASVVPSASSLVITALKEAPRDRKKEKNVKHNGNIPLDEIFEIARTMREKSFGKNLASVTKEILGTAQSVGCRVDGKPPHAIIEAIDAGEIDGSSKIVSDGVFVLLLLYLRYFMFVYFLIDKLLVTTTYLKLGEITSMSNNSKADVNYDKLFIQAVSTIKSLTDLSKSSNLPRPSITERLNLYGLYNQATKGDASFNTSITNPSDAKKYNSWVKFKGLTKQQARKQYVKYLLDILKSNYSLTEFPQVQPLLDGLQSSWDKIEFMEIQTPSTASQQVPFQFTPNIPIRSQSPAASLYRIASSGINSAIVRPSSRNHSISRSRHNSISGQNAINNNVVPNSVSQYPSVAITDITNHDSSVISNYNTSQEFIKWQNDINNTLLKISSEISSLKLNSKDAGHRTISGSTTLSTQSEIEDYKVRVSKIRNLSLDSGIGDYYTSEKSEHEEPHLKDIMNWIYRKLTALFFLRGSGQIMPTLKTQEHAAVEKPQSKPGRKPLTSEPKNKRTAQNRAAQRAFRERKERRMKELEEKVAELEKEKMQIENESELLRSQVSSLMKQLNDVNGGVAISSASSSVSPLEDKLFGTNSTSVVTPVPNEFTKLQANLPSSASISSSTSMSYFGDGESIKLTPESNEDSEMNLNLDLKNKLNNTNFKGHYHEQVFCNELSGACGSKSCPIPKTKSNISGIASSVSSPLGLLGTKSVQTESSQTGSNKESGEISSDDYLSNILLDKKVSKDSPKITDWNFGIDPAFSRSNEMDFLFADSNKTLDTEKLIQNNPSAFKFDPNTSMFDSNRSDPFDFDFDINENDIFEDLLKLPQEEQNEEQNVSLKSKSAGVFDAGHLSDDDEDEEVPDNSSNMLHCSQIWERITTHPRFTELDIDNLCDELKQKAKCSDTGVVVDGNVVNKMLQKVMKENQPVHQNTKEEQIKKLISNTDDQLNIATIQQRQRASQDLEVWISC
ncbi:hypothetical protein CANINC_003816 [Pichia inconspicua]|uniref:BZIP domain-containing protein n=1 Tax=Pichia inconspicua TaxID=52247 RepID=A0A4V4NFF4_9ASCO|nr:hypothetical protein CANINC_003816 [[Candida] inconspicua]